MMTEQEAYALGVQIAGDLPLAEEVSVVRDEWTGAFAVYVRVHGHEALIVQPREWPVQVFTTWPFGVVEGAWTLVAARRWYRQRKGSAPLPQREPL